MLKTMMDAFSFSGVSGGAISHDAMTCVVRVHRDEFPTKVELYEAALDWRMVNALRCLHYENEKQNMKNT